MSSLPISEVITAIDLGVKGWGWLQRWGKGTIKITNLSDRDPVDPGWVELSGVHERAKGHFWLFTCSGEKYWPQCEIRLIPGGRWKEKISVGNAPGERLSIVLVAHLSELLHALFMDIKVRSQKANFHDAVVMKPQKDQFYAVQVVVLQVRAKSNSR